ncbi:MAG: hypothetical protein R3C28_30350 [Pirellulaceae bacterium]
MRGLKIYGVGLFCLWAALGSQKTLLAQNINPAQAVLDERKRRDMKRELQPILMSSTAPTREQQNKLGAYYVRCIFDAMVHPSALQSPETLPALREELLSDVRRANNNALHTFLIQRVAYPFAGKIWQGNYPTACKYSALLILGELNQTELQRTPQQKPPIPLPNARRVLLSQLKKKPDALHIAALIGLKRHAELLAAAQQTDNAMGAPLLNILKMDPATADMSADGVHWMKKLAVETLGAMKVGGVAKYIVPVMADTSNPAYVRCAAADALANLNSPALDANEVAVTLKLLGELSVEVCMTEIDRQNSLAESSGGFEADMRRARPAPRSPEEGGTFVEPEVPAHPLVDQARRRLKSQLGCINAAMKVLKPIADPDANLRNTHGAIDVKLNDVLKFLDDNPSALTPKDLVDQLTEKKSALQAAIPG